MDKIKIDSDDWKDIGRIYKVRSAIRREGSTAIELVLEDEEGQVIYRTEAYHKVIAV